jgi:hexosaminidase
MNAQSTEAANLPIVPRPVNAAVRTGEFVIDSATVIVAGIRERETAQLLKQWIGEATGYSPRIAKTATGRTITLNSGQRDESLGREGYKLIVSSSGITIDASTDAGLFYGAQSLRQLAMANGSDIPGCEVIDYPRFGWRGSMVDVSRHFMPKAWILKYIDLIAFYKLNVLHLHLCDDQGWRIEIKKYPKLVEVGSKRAYTMVGENGKWTREDKAYSGYFTQSDLKEIVAYAKSRFITVVPEIEMPGHSVAAIAAYPEHGNTGKPLEVTGHWGVHKEIYNVEDRTIQYLKDVLDEVMSIFPSTFIHVGGDEVPKDQWKASASAQAKIQLLGIKNEEELQSWFIKTFDQYLASKGRRLIGWDEILEGGLAPGAAAMSWRGIQGGIHAAQMGHDVVMAPTSHTYFDYYQSKNTASEPHGIGGFLPIETVYSFDPVPKAIADTGKQKHVLGVQFQLWSEYIRSSDHMEYMAFPRACALAEVAWSPTSRKDYADFWQRLSSHAAILSRLGVNFRPLDKP